MTGNIKLRGGADRVLRQHAADLVGLLGPGVRDRLPHLLLTLAVGVDREGHELVERHAVLGIDVEQLRRDGGELQPLLHHGDRDEEGGGNLLFALALVPQRDKGTELVERVERCALDVLGERILLRQAFRADDAGDRGVPGKPLFLHQQLQRPVAPSAGGHFEYAGLGAAFIEHGPDGQALQQRSAGDILGEFLDRDAGLDLADVRLAEHELVEGDVARGAEADLRLGLGHDGSP